MATGDIIKAKVKIIAKRYYNASNDYGIVEVKTEELILGKLACETKKGTFVVKGTMPEPIIDGIYLLIAEECEDPKYGKQYKALTMTTSITLEEDDTDGQKRFLLSIFTPSQVEAMYEALENPYKTFIDKDTKELIKVKGAGIRTIPKWINKFYENLELGRLFVELENYQLTTNMLKKLLKSYGSTEIIVKKIKENPYTLMELDGFGWKRCDEIALKGGFGQFSSKRVEAFIMYYLDLMAQDGFSYLPLDYSVEEKLHIPTDKSINLMDALISNLGEHLPDEPIIEAINNNKERLWYSDDHTLIGLKKYYNLEMNIAKELLRIRDGENNFVWGDWEKVLRTKQESQGWEYTDEQMGGIVSVMDNQVTIIYAAAGAGKTSIVDGMLAVATNYSHAMCALSGRAASRMAEVTGDEGYTIHRLLGYPNMHTRSGFTYDSENKLPYDIIIVDEISMVDGWLFYNLIRAIKDGAKLIMLGDVSQLESIGCLNIAADLIKSNEITSIHLTKIHRQAAKSAIIAESTKIRHGEQITPYDWTGEDVRGELQDLQLDCYSDKNNTFFKTMQHFAKELPLVDSIMDIQVIAPIKKTDSGVIQLNNSIQELYNPEDNRKKEITVYYDKNNVGVLRVGDKIINKKNNYKTVLYNGQWEDYDDQMDTVSNDNDDAFQQFTGQQLIAPIYNGSLGIIKDIDTEKRELVVNFEGIGQVLIPKEAVSNIELGYACTTHSGQGSQWDRIIYALDFNGYALLTKEQVYTAITRAKKHCTIVAQTNALRYAIQQNGVSCKQTHLVRILDELTHPKMIF